MSAWEEWLYMVFGWVFWWVGWALALGAFVLIERVLG